MDKNTIWAIVLSTVVVIVAFVVQPILFPRNTGNNVESTEVVEETKEVKDLSDALSNADFDENSKLLSVNNSENFDEEVYTITTDKVKVVLTNKGGDILSYELIGHKDTDTGNDIQISDNISDFNRTCSVALGDVNTKIINEVFETQKIDDYTYIFKKSFIKDGKKFTLGKKYSFMPGEYMFKLDVLIHSDEEELFGENPIAYTLRTSPQMGPHYNPKRDRYETRQFLAYNGNKYKKISTAANQFKDYDKDFIWAGMAGKYFVELVIPTNSEILNKAYYSTKTEVNNYQNAQALFERNAFAGKDIQDTYYMYFGPRVEKDLKRYNVAENNGWGISGYKLTQCLQNDWLNWLENILKWILLQMYKIIPNLGICIIILTLLIKTALFPLSKKQSLGTLKMQELQPKLKVIQEKYKNDQQKMQMETQKLYKEAGYNPASGCLPMILQFILLMAMFYMFNNCFEFRGAMFIPGWIPDLASGDSVYTLKFNIPLIGNQIRILPVIYVAVQIISARVTQFGQPAGGQGATQGYMKFMMYGMPLLFFFMFYNASSGLLLYWTISSLYSIVQQLIINDTMNKKRIEMGLAAAKENANKKLPPKAKAQAKKAASKSSKNNKKL